MKHMKEKNNIKKYYFLIVLFIAVLIRCINLNQPLLEGSATRQVENAMIARNFYQDKLDIFYPYLNDYGKDPVYQLVEFQLIPFIGTVIYRILGGVYEPVLRCIIIFFFALSTVVLYKLVRYYFDETLALCSVFVFSFSPISIYLGRAFHYEMPMIFFILVTLYCFSLWKDKGRPIYIFISSFSFGLALLLKITNFYIILILIFLALNKFREKIFKKVELYIFLGITLMVVLPWYIHARAVMVKFPNKYSIYYINSFGFIWQMIKYWLANPVFYKINFDNLVTYTLTPLGFTLAIAGFFIKVKDKNEWLMYVWLASACILFALVPAQATQGYYQIHLLLPCSLLIGRSIKRLINLEFFGNGAFKKIFIFLFSIAVSLVVLRYAIGFYKVPENRRNIVKAGKEIQRLTQKDDLIIASVENSPELLYYCNRSGWPFTIDMEAKKLQDKTEGTDISNQIYDPIAILEQLRKEGADYFVSASVEREFLKNKEFLDYMFKNYKVLIKNSKFVIFDLRERIP